MRMRLLLNALRQRVQAGRIVVVGYYPLLSQDSDPLRLPFMLSMHGIGAPFFVDHMLLFRKVFQLCELFWEKFDRRLKGGGRGIERRRRERRGRVRVAWLHAANATFGTMISRLTVTL